MTRRSLSHSRRRCTADCPPTVILYIGSASPSNNGEESVATTRTPLGWALAHTDTDTAHASTLSHGGDSYGRYARDESGDASAGRQPVGVRAAPFGPVRRLSCSFGFVLLAMVSAAGLFRRSELEGSLGCGVGNRAAAQQQRQRQHRREDLAQRNIRVCCRWPQRRAP